MDQELDICNRVYELATYSMRRVWVTIKKYGVNKPPYVQARLFTGKKNEVNETICLFQLYFERIQRTVQNFESSVLINVKLRNAL